MPYIKQLALVSVLTGMISAQSSTVTQIFFPLADQQPLDASVIGQDGDVKTLVMQCVPGTDSSDCGFPEPITLTAGPSTLHHIPTGIWNVIGEIDCKITASTEADCTFVTGDYPELSTATEFVDITTPAASSSTEVTKLTGTDLVWLDVTITGGQANAVSTPTATGTVSTTDSSQTRTSSVSGGTASSATSSASDAASGGDNLVASSWRIWYSGLAAAVIAGSMIML